MGTTPLVPFTPFPFLGHRIALVISQLFRPRIQGLSPGGGSDVVHRQDLNTAHIAQKHRDHSESSGIVLRVKIFGSLQSIIQICG